MVVTFSKALRIEFKNIPLFLILKKKINCFSSRTSHMTDSEFIVFLPKLWVPTNFHTGSQELRFIRIFWNPGVAGGKLDGMAYY